MAGNPNTKSTRQIMFPSWIKHGCKRGCKGRKRGRKLGLKLKTVKKKKTGEKKLEVAKKENLT